MYWIIWSLEIISFNIVPIASEYQEIHPYSAMRLYQVVSRSPAGDIERYRLPGNIGFCRRDKVASLQCKLSKMYEGKTFPIYGNINMCIYVGEIDSRVFENL